MLALASGKNYVPEKWSMPAAHVLQIAVQHTAISKLCNARMGRGSISSFCSNINLNGSIIWCWPVPEVAAAHSKASNISLIGHIYRQQCWRSQGYTKKKPRKSQRNRGKATGVSEWMDTKIHVQCTCMGSVMSWGMCKVNWKISGIN